MDKIYNKVEFIVEEYTKYSDETWHLRSKERVGEYGISLCLRNGKFYYNNEEVSLNKDPNSKTCGAYYKVSDIVRMKDYVITEKRLCEFTEYRLRPIKYVIGVIVHRDTMPTYFFTPKAKANSYWGHSVEDVCFTKDIMELRKELIRRFKGNMHFDEKNRIEFANII